MVTIDTEPIKKAFAAAGLKKRKASVLAEVAPETFEKVMAGTGNPSLESVERVATLLGYDVFVVFKKAKAVA